MTDEAKTEADQVGEITKLVEDAQEKLDQVVRALRMLPQRWQTAGPRRDRSRLTARAPAAVALTAGR